MLKAEVHIVTTVLQSGQ